MGAEAGEQDREYLAWREFGAWLEGLRKRRGLTQNDVVSQSNRQIGRSTIAALERGGFQRYTDGPWVPSNPRDETLYILARLYGVDAEELFRRVGRYEDRPQTRQGARTATGQKAGRERIAELESRDRQRERELAEVKERLQALEARFPKQPRADAATGRRSRRSPG